MRYRAQQILWLKIPVLTICLVFTGFLKMNETAANPIYSKSYGSSLYDEGRKLVLLPDGGSVIFGRSANSDGNIDLKAIRIDENGELIWEQTFGGDQTDEVKDAILLSDGNLLVVGNTDSYGQMAEYKDLWVVKLDINGSEMWNKYFGGEESFEEGTAVDEDSEGNIVIAGSVLSINEEDEAIQNAQIWKLDKSGELIWAKSYGGAAPESAMDILVEDSAYYFLGNTETWGKGKQDGWLVKLDLEGNQLWDKTYGGGDGEMLNSMVRTSDGGFLLAGYSYTFANGSLDAWVVKTDSLGLQSWWKVYGGVSTDEVYTIVPSGEHDFLLIGYTDVYEMNEEGENISTVGMEILLVKINDKGGKLWERAIGGKEEQRGFDVAIDAANKILITGYSNTDPKSGGDIFVMRLNETGE